MTIELVGLLVAAWLGNADVAGKGSVASWFPDVTFRPRDRSVSNWRSQAAANLGASYGTAINILLGHDPSQVTRCVRLNNYWCIKRAGWAGEIAADSEGHVAFASAAEGADVAALLLRRYYVDYGRHSALAIVSHWAPASCGSVPVATGARTRKSRMANSRPSPADHLALHGIGHTLRARFLANRGRRVAGIAKSRMRRSVIPDRLIGMGIPAPAIAVGLGETPVSLGTQSLASMPLTALGTTPSGTPGAPSGLRVAESGPICVADTARIRAYAAKAAAGVAAGPSDDLHLFDPTGRPTANLARLMHNMSAVEIGPLGASTSLIAAAVDHATALAEHQASRQAASPIAAKASVPLATR